MCKHTQIPDWSREQTDRYWDPGRRLLQVIRQYQFYAKRKGLIAGLIKKTTVLRYHFWSAVSGADIPLNTEIGGGLLLPHPNGVVIHPGVKIGANCLFFQQVTIGMKSGEVPIIGHHVDIGAGAKVLGGIIVGNNVQIGANAVVIHDIPDGAIVVGVPAKVVGFGD